MQCVQRWVSRQNVSTCVSAQPVIGHFKQRLCWIVGHRCFWPSVFLHHMWALVVVMHRLAQPLFCKRWTEKKSYFEEKWNWVVFGFKKSLDVNWLNLAFVKAEHSCKCQQAAFWVTVEIRHIAQKSLPPRFPFRQEGVTLHVSCPIPRALATFRLLSWC